METILCPRVPAMVRRVQFAAHAPVEEWIATQDVVQLKEAWLRDGFVVVHGLVREMMSIV